MNAITRRRRFSHGFSLVELTIVLGIIGVVMGGVWTWVTNAWENQRQEQLSEEIATVVKNTRAAFSGQQNTGGSGLLNTQLINAGAFPASMLRAGVSGVVDNPWNSSVVGGSFVVCGWSPGLPIPVCGQLHAQYFAIELEKVPLSSCITAAVRNSGIKAVPGLVNVFINSSSLVSSGFPVSPATAQSKCTVGSTLDFVFRLTAPPS